MWQYNCLFSIANVYNNIPQILIAKKLLSFIKYPVLLYYFVLAVIIEN